jgi:hypothetical protein
MILPFTLLLITMALAPVLPRFFSARRLASATGPNLMVKAIADRQKNPHDGLSGICPQVHIAFSAAGAYNRLVAFLSGVEILLQM